MGKKQAEKAVSEHPFGGCDKLLNHYKTIGETLLSIEAQYLYYAYGSHAVQQEFRERVSFVSVEILESYLEDVLDRSVSLDFLHIVRPGIWNRFDILTIISVICAGAAGAYLSLYSHSSLIGVLVTCSLVLPVLIVWFRSPFGTLARRVGFARIISHEIARRRGSSHGVSRWSNAGAFSFGEMWGAPSSSSQVESAKVGITAFPESFSFH